MLVIMAKWKKVILGIFITAGAAFADATLDRRTLSMIFAHFFVTPIFEKSC